jgi:hypothetical protein
MDISTVDVPGAVSAIMAIAIAAGGVVGKAYIGKALEGLSMVADVLVDVGQLMITIAKAGEDGKLSEEEWTQIKEQARDIQAHLLAMQGKFGTILS